MSVVNVSETDIADELPVQLDREVSLDFLPRRISGADEPLALPHGGQLLVTELVP